jgi:hypothetical protein
MADPIPDAPPVTIATLPRRLKEGIASTDASCGGLAGSFANLSTI